jgi:beta-glucosidase
MELPAVECYGEPLKAEVEAGRMPLAVVDRAVRRVLRLKFQLGLFERPYVDAAAANAAFETPEQRTLARQAVVDSAILLSNDGVLPLAPTLKRLAVIGPGANDERLMQGDYHYPAHLEMIYAAPQNMGDFADLDLPQAGGAYAPGPYFTRHITPLAGLREALGNTAEIGYAKGCEVLGEDRSGFAEAAQVARDADVAVVVVAGRSGLLRSSTVGEGNDATNLDLTGVQQELVEAIAETGTTLVVVVLSGRVHTLARLASRANALLQVFPPGEEGGNGLADVLTGKANPSGRLPVSLPRSVGQVPNSVGLRAGGNHPMFYGDYIDSPTSPLFAFGYGLSYTTFAYSDLAVQARNTTEPIEVSIEVRNIGERAGDEVVQLYCRDQVASVARPERMLLGFARLSLPPGQARTITFTIHPSRLAFYDPQMRFVTEPGAFTFSIGASSVDIRAEKTIVLDGEVAEYRQREIVSTKVQFE